MMRILYITNGIDGSGGLERVLSLKASWLADTKGYEVHVLVLNGAYQQPFFSFSPKIIFHSIAVGGNPFAYWRAYSKGLVATVKAIQPQLILVCDDGLKAFFLPLFLKKYAPLIYERHVSRTVFIGTQKGLLPRIVKGVQARLITCLATRFDRFVVLTSSNRKEWPLSNLTVIPNPLPFYPESVAAQREKVVLAVGKQSYQKGYDLLVQAWAQIAADFPDWRLEVYGKLDPNQGLESLAKTLQVDASVHFFPPQKNISAQYQKASLYVMSSRYEGFGMVLIEAMAHGLPCVTFDCPHGPGDLVQHETTGLVIPSGDVAALAQGMARLMADASLRESWGTTARADVTNYAMETVGQQWIALFETVVGARNFHKKG
ncbi:glycosyltransferase family 4 protein [Flavobacterium sp.]|jgi:glycosyltransferase involved in cell wall biosynthesis|uniref:glycosyltransferase family 4 protein n=1 Tax=Flavobacterium sp. TaxID=239 RepID=UPI0022C11E68|nr:glycosyltransferase family 4 protein [Flavobacterium sp.]MCZ8144126.1 glycosyltransferase family 4 protein [Flavobacterium sp.]MCZ8366253.1 glycosyltransferase family 4 protein [Flavobacterium sp.]